MAPSQANHDFIHRPGAHCESGTTSSLLHHYGLSASEPLVFGIGAGIYFGYFPFIKIYGAPFITYRNTPGSIFKKTARRFNVHFEISRFKDQQKAMDALDSVLDRGLPVGLQTGVYWLPYMPEAMRFHFNAHNLIVYGKKGDDYLISDPVLDRPVVCPGNDLLKARFAKGFLAPRGRMYYISHLPEQDQINIPQAVRKGIKDSCRAMTPPFPLVGVRGIRTFAKSLRKWPDKVPKRRVPFFIGHTIRMQEEIGTGGGGFRLMYAAFLQEAAHILKDERLMELSKRMDAIGDRWREFAVTGARICKNRSADHENLDLLGDILLDCAQKEERLFKDLREIEASTRT